LILLTGATGYVGGRLLHRLEDRRYQVRALVRNRQTLSNRVVKGTEIVQGDVLEPGSLETAFVGIDTAYYLIHSMGQARGFEDLDRQAAENFGQAASRAGVRRIIYVGGLGDDEDALSPHLRSRQEVGRILRESGVPTLELRASIVIGSGSLSYEMIRSLTEKLPVMITPRWVNVKAQPIGIEDLLQYLMQSIEIQLQGSRIIEIGGPEQVSYKDLMIAYAKVRGLKRYMLPVPVLTPHLSSLWLGLVTPLFARVGRKLVDSIRHASIVRHPEGQELFDIQPMGILETIESAVRSEDLDFAETRWSDAISSSGLTPSYGGIRLGNRLADSREIQVNVPAETAFASVARIGGENGWYAYNWLWQIRGTLDLLLGGVGKRRRRPQGRALRVGDSLDFWRVEIYDPPERLRLIAEMKVPGQAWLEFEVIPQQKGCRIQQTAVFLPAGLGGLLYWYGIYPIHVLVFRGMIKGVAREAETAGHSEP